MLKIAVLLLGLVFSATALSQTTAAEVKDTTVEDINLGQLAAEVIAEIRQDCSLLAESEEIESEYFSGFVEVCVIDNVAMALAYEQGDDITDEMAVEEYTELL